MKRTCDMCNGQGYTHEMQTYPDEPAEWWEDCAECAGTGLIELPLLDWIKDQVATIIFKIRCIPYNLKYKQPLEDSEIPF